MLFAATATAQPATQPEAAVPADGALAGKESSQGVYVRDSAVAVEKFALAQRMERLKEWDKAADALQEVIEKHADRVMPSQVDANNVIYQYTSVTTAVQERLAKWPAEGLDVYRARFEPQAAALLEQAGPDDLGALHRAVALYFVTETGKTAGLRLVDLYLESGEFPAAAWLVERLLAWHPSIEDERPKLLYRAGLAYHLAGDVDSATAKLDELKKNFPDAKGAVRGEEVVLLESLATELQTAPPVARGATGDSWPMLGGSADRGRIPEAGGRLGALINFTEYVRPARGPRSTDPRLDAMRQEAERTERRDRGEGFTLGVFPAVDRGDMFFQDNARLYAVSVETGVVLPGWQATYGDRGGRYVVNGAVPLPRNQHFTVTVTDNSVLAVLGQVDGAMMMNMGFGRVMPGGVGDPARLVCLDRATGRERWTVSPRQLPQPLAQLRSLSLGGSPLVVGDNVYILGRGGKPMQFEDTYVLCYSLKDGSFRWSCYLASGNADPNAMRGGMMPGDGDNVSHLAYASGRLYALTNLGALAAVDAYSGTIVWLNIYPRPKPEFEIRARWNRAENTAPASKPWHHNPVIVKDGKVFILPNDAQHLLVYDAGSGVELKRIRMDQFDNAKTLLAVAGDRLILSSDASVFAVNWQAYNPESQRDANLFWQAGPFEKQNFKPNDTIRGRGFVTSDSVFVSTGWALFRLSLKSGRIEQSYPRDRVWDAGEGPGNVLVTEDHVILATADRVNVYTDLAVARQRLDASVAAAPSDPEPRLRYAEMMFVSNQLDVGLAKLDEATNLLGHDGTSGGGASAIRPGPQRDRAFSIALTFAEKLADPEANTPAERELSQQLFDRAAIAAHLPAQQVNYRMTRARFAEPPQRVRLYQEVLADEALRTVPYAADESGSTQAAVVAEAGIDQIIQQFGASVYEPYEAEAKEALTAARDSNDPDALLAVARRFPNAGVAPEAMMSAAEAYETADNPRRATQVLNLAYRRYGDTVDPAQIIEGQVRNYLKLPDGLGIAIGRLRAAPRGAKLRKPLMLPDGTKLEPNVTLTEVAAALHRVNATTVAAALPVFGLPESNRDANGKFIKPFLPEQPGTAIGDVDMLVVPRRDAARHDRVITWTANKGLAIYPVGESNPVGSHVPFTDTPKGAAWVGDGAGQVLVWGPTTMVLLAAQTGAQLWEATLKELGTVEVAAMGEAVIDAPPTPGAEAAVIIQQQQMIQMRLNVRRGAMGGAAVVDIDGIARVQPAREAAGGPIEHIDQVRIAGDRAVLSTTTGRVAGIELAAGKAAWQTRLAEGPIVQLLANDDFTVARFADGAGVQIAALDTFTGQPVTPRRVYPLEGGRQPVNMALSPDGMLVWTLQGQLCGKNLYEPGEALTFQVPEQADGNPRYATATLPDQLVIANGQILVVTDNGQMVRVHSLADGKPLPEPKPLATGAPQSPGVTLRPLGSRVYIVNSKGVASYNLDRAGDAWGIPPIPIDPPPAVRDVMIGQDYLVLLDQLSGPVNANPAGANAAAGARQGYRLLAHSRAPIKRSDGTVVESGRLDYYPIITGPAGISSEWQGVNGGFYYRTLDRTVRFLRGARTS
ncbi:MAG TPA: PQQ-binding-like beta-propeller repeat protein [Tepidisphaeraceae bacterium]|nr:PQQ-binding-like beta-propeller repeat protein [Tepidisphaeraceae bacterium]